MSFVGTRRVVFGIVLASFVLSFFHRTAPAAIASELTRAFSINAAILGTLAATYFYVYTVLQIPVGVLADTLGPRKLLAAGSVVAGIGSLVFALAPALGNRGGRSHAGRHRRVGRVHRDPQGVRRLVSREPLRDAGRRDDVRRQPRRRHRRRAARVDRHADVVAKRVRRRSRCSPRCLAIASWLLVRDTPQAYGFPAVNAIALRQRAARALDASAG